MKVVAMLSAVGLVGGASTELPTNNKREILELTGKNSNPPDCSSDSTLKGEAATKKASACAFVWISLEHAVEVGLAIVKEVNSEQKPNQPQTGNDRVTTAEHSKLAAVRLKFPNLLSEKAAEFEKSLRRKTLDAAELLVNLKSNYQSQLDRLKTGFTANNNAIINPFQVVCKLDYQSISSEESMRTQIANSLKAAGPIRESGAADVDENYLLPMIRMLHGFEACVQEKAPPKFRIKEPQEPLQPTKYIGVKAMSLEDYKRRYGDDGKLPEPKQDPIDKEIESPKTNDGSETQADPMDPSALQSDIERKMELIKNLASLNTQMRQIGTDVLEASARIIYIAALNELLQRIQSQEQVLKGRQDDAKVLITLTMTATRAELAS